MVIAIERIERTQRGIRIMAGVIIALWLLAGAALVASYYAFFVFLAPRMLQLLADPAPPDPSGDWRTIFQLLAQVSIPVVISAGITCVLAATGTILLVLHARRTTLRHVGANLAALSAEIKELQRMLAERGSA